MKTRISNEAKELDRIAESKTDPLESVRAWSDLLDIDFFREKEIVSRYSSETGKPEEMAWVGYEPWNGNLWIDPGFGGDGGLQVSDRSYKAINKFLSGKRLRTFKKHGRLYAVQYVPALMEYGGTVPAYFKFERLPTENDV